MLFISSATLIGFRCSLQGSELCMHWAVGGMREGRVGRDVESIANSLSALYLPAGVATPRQLHVSFPSAPRRS